MSDIDDILKTADMLEIVASGGNGAELVDLPWLLGVAVKELRETDALRAENERLRVALQRVDDDHGYGLPPDTRSMIRAALEEKP